MIELFLIAFGIFSVVAIIKTVNRIAVAAEATALILAEARERRKEEWNVNA